MNERDKELALQAGDYVNKVYTPPVRSKTPGKIWEDGHVGWHAQFNAKFADLIRADAMETATRAANESWTLMCKKMVGLEREALEAKDWTAIMREGSLVTWGDAEELGERVRATIRARGNT